MVGNCDWGRARAPGLAQFEELVHAAWRRLPAKFRGLCEDLVLRVEEFAESDVLDELNLESPYDLMGLYRGVSIDRKSVMDVAHGPDMIFLYRRPLLDYWAEGTQALGQLVTHVLIHEVGHHFGLSDEDMERIEASVID
jgi:predicted Zn-dependent protease with MMP-like domain